MVFLSIEEARQIARERGGRCISREIINSHTKLHWMCAKGHEWMAKAINVKRGTWCPVCAGNIPRSIEEMRDIARSREGKCLSMKYINTGTKLRWQCSKMHEWEATPNSIKNGTWCPHCAGRALGSISEMRRLASAKEGKCLSGNYVDNKTKLRWQCAKGHVWEAVPSSIKHGNTWCPHCSGRMSGSLEEMQRIAEKRKGKCLSEKYVNMKTKLSWRCSKGHEWEAAAGEVKYGTWCPTCAGQILGSIEEMQAMAIAKGGRCLSKEYINRSNKLRWQCAKGHEWEATPSHINRGQWCPKCAGVAPVSIDEMQSIATERGGKCLSERLIDMKTKMRWRCLEGHEWEATPNSIKNGTWCPACSSSLGERICRAYFEEIFYKPFPAARPKWLRNMEGNRLELDGYCAELNLAFEHQGEQHYSNVPFYQRTDIAFKKRVRDDELKGKLCKEHGIVLISIPEIGRRLELTKLLHFIVLECKKYEITLPLNVEQIQVDINRVYRTPKSKILFEEVNKIAAEKGGKCLSENYISATEKLRWQCVKGHEWKANPNTIKNGYWCPHCAGMARGTIEEMREIAVARGGKCLSEKYVNNRTKLHWSCANGHEWKAAGGAVKLGSWCPTCAGNVPGTLEEMQKLATLRGGKCLSQQFVNSGTRLQWQCSEGHEWAAVPSSVKKGSWCAICSRKTAVNKLRLSIEEMRTIAADRGGKCLSEKYVNAITKLRWKCSEKHEWEAVPGSIKNNGTWCPYCSKRMPSSIEEMRRIAAAKGGECLSDQYVNSKAKLGWRCSKGHEWKAVPGSIKKGHWCPWCGAIARANRLRFTINDMKKLAEAKGGKCLSTRYINNHIKLLWQCSQGHTWETTQNSVQQGHWCPHCKTS